MNFHVVTLFQEVFDPWMKLGLVGQACSKKIFDVKFLNPRAFTSDVHQAVDDKVYGGGDGMAATYEPWSKAIKESLSSEPKSRVVFLTPQGALWDQKRARVWLEDERPVTLVCGRYAGFDERLLLDFAEEEISIGDFVLNGGELPAMTIMETLIRGLPGVLGKKNSFEEDSFGVSGLFEPPQFTRPQEVNGRAVPSFLLSGHHQNIQALSQAISIVRTQNRRPELLKEANLSEKQIQKAHELISTLSEEERKTLGVFS